jgi:sulfur-oxidizing protein SoxZ
MDGTAIQVKMLLRHPMETGARKHPATGKLLPRHFIQELVCSHNGTPVLTLDWGWGIAADPYLAFRIRNGKPGDRITIRWLDDRGASGEIEGEVS